MLDDNEETLVDLLRHRAVETREPGEPAYRFLANGSAESEALTYRELDLRARAIAAELQAARVAPGERALVLYPPGLELIAALFGCFYAGVVAVPAVPPRPHRDNPRLRGIAEECRPAAVLTTPALLGRRDALLREVPRLAGARWIATAEIPAGREEEWRRPGPAHLGADTLAFLQFTSGSTADPKGVMVSHRNFLHNEKLIRDACGHSAATVFVGWLPLYHDMGLMGNVLQPLYLGGRCVLMAPQAFLQSPARWLEAVSRFRATTSGGPDFAYDLCVRRIGPEQRAGLDLSSWTVAFNGAEPVRAATLERFAEAFAGCGFRREAFFPCYGLAEATLYVAGAERPGGAKTLRVDPEALGRGEAVPAEEGLGRVLVSCGRSPAEQSVMVVDPESGAPLPTGRVGEVWVAGPSVAQGYWERPEATRELFGARLVDGAGPFLRTGDLGFLVPAAGEGPGDLFVTGRLKDLIILRGRNLYPQDVEETAERAHPAVQPGAVAAFALEVDGEERLAVVVERRPRSQEGIEAVAPAVRRAVAEEHQVQVHTLVLARPGEVPKTTSGKVRRRACRERFLGGEMEVAGVSVAGSAEEPAAWEGEAPERGDLLAAAPEERRAAVAAWLRREAGRALRVDPERLDPDEPLAATGLDSLAAVELEQRMEEALGVAVPLAELLDGATLAGLAERLVAAAAVVEEAPSLSAAPSPTLPLSPMQQAIWFQQQLAPESPAYNVPFAVRLGPEVEEAALVRALEILVERHEVLRTRVTVRHGVDGRPAQRFAVEGLAWERRDLPEADRADLLAAVAAEAHRPFDLERGPLFRAALFAGPQERVLLLCAHHIAIDGASLWILLDELRRLVGSHPLPPLPWDYGDFVRWQAERLDGPAGERLWEFWRRELGGAPPALDLPYDRVPAPGAGPDGGAEVLRLGEGLIAPLRALAAAERATLYTVLLAAFQVLLGRHADREEVVVGTPAAGRTRPELRGMVGCLFNTVAVRADLAGDPPFRALAGQVRGRVAAALEHQDFPSHRLAERLRPGGEAPRAGGDLAAFFPVVFLYQQIQRLAAPPVLLPDEDGVRIDLGDLVLDALFVPPVAARSPLELELVEADGAALGWLRYRRDRFDPGSAARLARQYRALLRDLAENGADRPVSELSCLDAQEREQLLRVWSGTGRDYREPVRVHELFERQARRAPDAVAGVWKGEPLSYGELDREAEKLAGLLAERGPQGGLIGLKAEAGPALLVGMLGILKSGRGFLPLDPDYPAERLEAMVAGAGVGWVVGPSPPGPLSHLPPTTRERGNAGEGEGPRTERLASTTVALEVVPVGTPVREPGGGSFPLPQPAPSQGRGTLPPGDRGSPSASGDLAYVLYTSGSTGTPKGVPITHENLVPLLLWSREYFGLGPRTRVLQSLSYGFDFGVFEILSTLAWGGTIHLLGREERSDVGGYLERIRRHGINTVHATPSFFRAVAAAAEAAGDDLDGLETVHLGGEALAPELVEAALRLTGGRCAVYNGYGPTEATVNCAVFRAAAPGDGSAPGLRGLASVPIGRPSANNRLYVLGGLERGLRPVPPGAPGELYVGGAGLSPGYLGDPGRTAERFVPNPFDEPGGRLYATGDRVRLRAEEELEFLGRFDHQVKVRGFRVEPGEIEAALRAHQRVAAAAVVARKDGQAEPRLVAYVAAQGVETAELRRFLARRLPAYLVPAAFVVLPELPLTRNGKVDRRALPEPPEAGAEAGRLAPRTPTEAAVAAIWSRCLGVEVGGGGGERVGVEDDFFALGGHSLMVTQVLSHVRQELGVEVPLREMFESPTVAALAAIVERAGRREFDPIRPVPRGEGDLPLSFAQERLWFLAQLDPESLAYHVPRVVWIEGDYRVRAMERAYEALVARHEILRTVLRAPEGRPVQHILPPRPFVILEVDLSGLPEAERDREVGRLIQSEVRRPFDLVNGPMLRAIAARLGAERHVHIQTEHHLVHDGWTQGVLLHDLLALYAGFYEGRPVSLPPLPIQYADYAVWQRGYLTGEVLARELAYWKERLAGLPPVLELPADRPRPPVQSYRGATIFFDFPEPVLPAVHGLARREGVTPFMVLLGAFAVLLGRHARRDDVPMAVPIANRTHVETEGLIGFFVNTLVLRADLSGWPSFRAVLGRVRSMTLGAYAHQHLPFERLVEELAPERDLSHVPLAQVMFILQNAPLPPLEMPGARLEYREVHNGTAKFDVLISLQERRGVMGGGLEYSTDLFDETTLRRFLRRFQTILEETARDPERSVRELPLLTEAERQEMLAEWTVADPARSGPPLLVDLFAAQAKRTPDAVALVDGSGGALSYRELAGRVDEISARLAAAGVGLESRVAVFLEPGVDLPAALLAVHRAGGAYVPLDPSHPAERTGFILADAGVAAVVARSSLAGRLPEVGVPVVWVDEGLSTPLSQPPPPRGEGQQPRPGSDNLAYVIYTSGSTGRPKGVEVSHGALVNFLRSVAERPGLAAGEALLATTTVAFDIAGLELFLPLITGARAVLVGRDVAADGRRLGEVVATTVAAAPAGIGAVLQATPATWSLLFEAGWRGDSRLRALCGGEALPPALAERLAGTCRELWNLYGPTETTIWSAVTRVRPGDAILLSGPPSGAVAGTRFYILDALDPAGAPAPVGIPGELAIGGAGLARGYHGRPDLTAERFVPDPFAPSQAAPDGAGARLYLTGDVARRLADGRIELLGRLDHQVKLRGFRIELGEVESALAAHPAVAEAVAVLRDDPPAGPQLVAYVVPAPEAGEGRELQEVSEWAEVWDQAYGADPGESAADPAFDISGWTSSYTGEPLGPEVMGEWVRHTVDRILALGEGGTLGRVLEIGCGTGLLLHRVAPHCRSYTATDVSPRVVERLRRVAAPGSGLENVAVLQARADELEGFTPGSFDVVILNSVVQYFPSVGYLLEVLAGVERVVAPGGRVFLGDIRSLPLLAAFRLDVERGRSSQDLPLEELRERLADQLARERELVLDPRFFPALARHLPSLTGVETQVKRGRIPSELTRFRYDVVLQFGGPERVSGEPAGGRPNGPGDFSPGPGSPGPLGRLQLFPTDWLDWPAEGFSRAALRERLRSLPADTALGVRGVPDARVHEPLAALRSLHGLPEAATGPAVDPEELWKLAAELGMEAAVTWASPHHTEPRPGRGLSEGHLEAVFRPRSAWQPRPPVPPVPAEPWSAYANVPRNAEPAQRLAPVLTGHLQARLPAYMVPAAFVFLDALPLNPSGKVDRKALPAPGRSRDTRVAFQAPRTSTEERLVAIWAEVLGVERIGVHDSFFNLGGHSLIATQLLSRVHRRLGVDLPLRALFADPTVAGLAGRIDQAGAGGAAGERLDEIRPVPRTSAEPLSFAQERLWFLDQLAPGSPFYNLPSAFALQGRLAVPALEAALGEVVRRHEVLRTTYPTLDGGPVQRVAPVRSGERIRIPVIDLAGLPAAAREAERDRLLAEEARGPFDLERGPLLRARLVRLAEREHTVAVTMHHIAGDGWSVGVLLREMAELYRAGLEERPSRLPALPVQYADFAAWQRKWLQGAELERQLAYWRGQLAGMPERLELPADRPRPAVQGYRGRRLPFALPAGLVADLETLGRGEGATLFMTLLAAVAVLFQRYSRQDDLAVGAPVANRRRPEVESLIGFFVNSLVLRVGGVAGVEAPGGRELLRQVRDTVLAAQEHQDLPFERLVEELRPARSLGHTPLFQHVLALHNAPVSTLQAPGLTIAPLDLDSGTAKFDLYLSLAPRDREGGTDLAGYAEYRTDLFDAATVERLVGHLETLLRGFVAFPGARASELPLLRGAERREVLALGDRRDGDLPADEEELPLPARFERQAEAAPGAVAVSGEERTLTYADLRAEARALAAELRALGVGPEVRVGLCAERSAEMVVGLLGILMAGGAYVPLDPDYPAERLAWLIEDAAVPVVVTHQEVLDRLPATGARRVLLDRRPAAPPVRTPAPEILPGHSAYVIYTSGSTGRPKGVVVTHRNASRLFTATQARFGFGPRDVWTLFHSYAFDFSVWEVWGALLHGGRLVVVPYWVSREPEEMYRLVFEERVTVLSQTPSAFSQLVRAEKETRVLPLALRYVVFGGEVLNLPGLAPWWERHGGKEPLLVNGYGITETTVFVSFRPVSPADLGAEAGLGSGIGEPIPDLEARVADRLAAGLGLCPLGVPGELCVGGEGLARGYLGRPDLTAARFVPDPWGGRLGARLYLSGDLARWRSGAGGTELEFLGRIDHQIKVRGFRVELGEIEAALAAQPGVSEAVVLPRGEGEERRLAAFVAAAETATGGEAAGLDRRELAAALRDRLPEYMVPAEWVFLDRLPLTPNGKVDRRALERLSGSLAPAAAGEAPRTPLEKQIAEIWAEVLELPAVGVHDNFFELGGHSLLATRIATRLRGALEVELPLRALFQEPTVAGLAREIERRLAVPVGGG